MAKVFCFFFSKKKTSFLLLGEKMPGICNGRVAIVTGAGHGLGRAYALCLAAEGACVVVNDLGVGTHGEPGASHGAAEGVCDEIRAAGGQAVADTGDVADWDAGRHMVELAVASFGRLDAVVNNAGFVRDRMFVSCTPEEWDAVLRVHLRGHFCTSRHAVDYWRAQQKAGHQVDARIINTTSGAGLQGSVGQSAYSTAKGGIATLTLVQAAELARYGITANALAPNARTRMTATGAFDMAPKAGVFDVFAPENTAPLVAYLVSAQSHGVTGQVFELKGGTIFLSQGWSDSPAYHKGARLDAAELDPIVRQLIATRAPAKPVYGAA
jgi:NAD(P)-dependent dehydrogenase (short-subunit alcohol dehydrogenase family)